jgi:hypothetical protein
MNWRICIVATWGRRMLDGGQIDKIYLLPFANLRLNPSVTWFAPGSASIQHPTSTWLAMSGDAQLLPQSALIGL